MLACDSEKGIKTDHIRPLGDFHINKIFLIETYLYIIILLDNEKQIKMFLLAFASVVLGFSCYSGSGVDSGKVIESIVCGPGVTNCKNESRRKIFENFIISNFNKSKL